MAQAYICLGTCPSGGISPTSYKSLLVAAPAAPPLATTFGAADASSLTRGGLTPEWAFECTAMTISSSTAKPARHTVPCVYVALPKRVPVWAFAQAKSQPTHGC